MKKSSELKEEIERFWDQPSRFVIFFSRTIISSIVSDFKLKDKRANKKTSILQKDIFIYTSVYLFRSGDDN